MKTQILNNDQVAKIIRRMAYQIYERNFNEKELIVAGIEGQGAEIARRLADEVSSISKLRISRLGVNLNKTSPSEDEIEINFPGGTRPSSGSFQRINASNPEILRCGRAIFGW